MPTTAEIETTESHWDAVEDRVNDALRRIPRAVESGDPDPYDLRHDEMVDRTRRHEAHHGGQYDLEGRGL